MAYELTQDIIYEFGETYKGPATRSRFTFTAPIIGEQAYAEHMISAFREQCEAEGLEMVGLKVWEDHSPLFDTPFLVEFTCCRPEQGITGMAGMAISGVNPALIVLIIKAVVFIVIAIVVLIVVKTIEDTDWPALEPAFEALKWIAIAATAWGIAYIITKAPKPALVKAK